MIYDCIDERLIASETQNYMNTFLNQAHAGMAGTPGFLKLILCGSLVCVYVCPHLRLLITSGMMWCDMDPMQLV